MFVPHQSCENEDGKNRTPSIFRNCLKRISDFRGWRNTVLQSINEASGRPDDQALLWAKRVEDPEVNDEALEVVPDKFRTLSRKLTTALQRIAQGDLDNELLKKWRMACRWVDPRLGWFFSVWFSDTFRQVIPRMLCTMSLTCPSEVHWFVRAIPKQLGRCNPRNEKATSRRCFGAFLLRGN